MPPRIYQNSPFWAPNRKKKFWGGGTALHFQWHSPLPRPSGEGKPLPTPHSPRRLRRLDSRAFGARTTAPRSSRLRRSTLRSATSSILLLPLYLAYRFVLCVHLFLMCLCLPIPLCTFLYDFFGAIVTNLNESHRAIAASTVVWVRGIIVPSLLGAWR